MMRWRFLSRRRSDTAGSRPGRVPVRPLLSAGRQANECRLAAVPLALADLGLVLPQLDDRQVREGRFEQIPRVKVRQDGRSTGSVIQLLRCVALEDEHAAGLEATGDALEQARARDGVGVGRA